METICKAWSDIIVKMGGTSRACKKDQCLTISTPVEIMKFDFIDINKVALMRGRVHNFILVMKIE